MARKPYLAENRERAEMSGKAKDGMFCVVGFSEKFEDGFGLQGWNYNRSEAEEKVEELNNSDEFSHVDEHRIMRKVDYKEFIEMKGVSKQIPSNW